VAVADGRALLDAFRHGGFDVALTDFDMPDVDGLSAAEAIRRSSPVPVVVMSGSWTAAAGDRAAAAGVHVLPKPFDLAALAAAVAAAVGGPT
jgi:CheY-like chemotaxis protein